MVCIYIIELKTRYKSVYAYDDGGSLSEVEYRSDDNNAYRVGFTYDRYGRRKRVSRMVPGTAGAVTTTVYSYNTMHRLLTLRTNGSDGSAISARRYTYDNVGNITQLRDIVTGMVHNYSYDGYYQLTGGSGQASDNSGNAYYGITVDYDRMHRPVAKNQQMGQTGMLFPGDVTVGYGLNYNYSPTHKFRLESVYRHHFRSEADVMVEGDVIHDVCRFSYDSNGNMTGIVTDRPAADGHTERRIAERKLLWDEENRLRAVDDNGFISCYFYDHTGRRTIKLTGGGRHTYINGAADTDSTDTKNCTIYPGPNTVFSFSDGAYRQGRLSRHIYAGNERILTAVSLRKPVLTSASGTSRRPFEAQKDTLQNLVKQIYADCGVPFKGSDNTAPSSGPVIDAESVYFYHPDHLGSTTLLTDATGCPTQRVEYAPFGELFLDRRDGTTWHTPYLFNAKELDEETGLYYYGARYYDPHLSLWISPDKLEYTSPDISTYTYCANRPVNAIDPDGKDWYTVDINGNFELYQKNEDSFDRIISNEMGNGAYIDINKSFMSSYKSLKAELESVGYGISTNVTISTNSATYDLKSVYDFLIANTDVEWSYIVTSDLNGMPIEFIGTSHNYNLDGSQELILEKAKQNNLIISTVTHNHDIGNTTVSKGDVEVAKKIQTYSPNAKFLIVFRNNQGTPILYDQHTPYGVLPEAVCIGIISK